MLILLNIWLKEFGIMKIKKVVIQGFRAYKSENDGTFDFNSNNGEISNFISIYAPNGFGKSSFYDAIEWGITNNISRYITDANRKSNELAAKSTKQEGIPQIILRNKFISEDIPTYVSIETSAGNFLKNWSKPRIDSMDLRFTESETDKNFIFFRNVILSQDNIDRFIREEKPENRYNSFMTGFCGEAEDLRKKVSLLISENRQSIDAAEENKKKILIELNKPVNEKVFEDYNNYVSELNGFGENIPLIIDGFNLELEQEIIAIVNRRKIEIGNDVNNLNLLKNNTLKFESKINEIKQKIDFRKKLNSDLDVLVSSISKKNKYQELNSIYLKYIDDLKLIKRKQERYDFTRDGFDQFIRTQDDINARLKEFNFRSSEKNILDRELNDSNSKLIDFDKEIIYLKKELHDFEYKLNNANDFFSKYQNSNLSVLNLEANILILSKKIESSKAMKLNFEGLSKEVFNFSVDVSSIISKDISIIGVEKDILNNFYENLNEVKNLEFKEKLIRDKQKNLTTQMSFLEKLIALGGEYFNLNKTNKCPLCQHVHNSPEDLKDLIENNVLTSEEFHASSVELAELLEQKSQFEKELKVSLINIEKTKNNKLEFLAKKINFINAEIKNIEEELTNKKNELDVAKKNNKNFQSFFSDMDLSDFNGMVDAKILEIKGLLFLKEQAVIEVKTRILEIKKNIDSLSLYLESAKSNIKRLELLEVYSSVKEFIVENDIDYNNFNSIYEEEKKKYNLLRNDLEKECDYLAGELEKLRGQLIHNNHWLSIDELNDMKKKLNDSFLDINLQINLYFNSIGYVVDKDNELDIDKYMKLKLDKLDDDIRFSQKLISNFSVILDLIDVIKPYSKSLRLRAELALIENELLDFNKVDKKLSFELENLIKYLSDYIKSFFYTDLINTIYRKIDPHPKFKEVIFEPDFSVLEKPSLNILIKDDSGETISPVIFFSSAQLNILSLSVFLSRAINARDNHGKPLDLILIDDPIQAMDSINVLSVIDLLRGISLKFNKQIIISTHDENFYRLLQKKIPPHFFNSKFFRLSSYGVVEKQF